MRTILLFSSFLFGVSALNCFHCHDCDRVAATIKHCAEGTQCYSILGTVTRRGCSHECPFNREVADEECHICTEDLCNHHQQGPFLRKAIHHRTRHQRQSGLGKVLSSVHYMADGSKKEHYVHANEDVPALPHEDIIQLSRGDPRIGTVHDGTLYLPVDLVTGEVLPEYRDLEKQWREMEQKPKPSGILEKKTVDMDGEKITEVITHNVELPPGVSKEDVVSEDDEEEDVERILGAAAFAVKEVKKDAPVDEKGVYVLPEARITQEELDEEVAELEKEVENAKHRHTLPPIPTEMSEEEMLALAERIESIMDEDEQEEDGKADTITQRPVPSSAAVRILSTFFLFLLLTHI